MSEHSSAQIIPFPRPVAAEAPRPAATVPSHPPKLDTPAERLQRALAVLERAVAAQKEAVGQWRGALQGLRGNVESLRGSLSDYDTALGALRGQVERVNKTARGLESWADGALAAAKAKPDQPK